MYVVGVLTQNQNEYALELQWASSCTMVEENLDGIQVSCWESNLELSKGES